MIIKAIIILMMLEVAIILLIIKAQAVKGQERLAALALTSEDGLLPLW